MTPIEFLDSAVVVEMYVREQRTQEYVATLQPIPPDGDTTDGGDEVPLNTCDSVRAEICTINSVDMFGPPSDVVVAQSMEGMASLVSGTAYSL
jgi:hypothetical protein